MAGHFDDTCPCMAEECATGHGDRRCGEPVEATPVYDPMAYPPQPVRYCGSCGQDALTTGDAVTQAFVEGRE